MHTAHIELFYALRIEVYEDVSSNLRAHVQHIADYMLERWWVVFTEAHAAEVSEVNAYA